MKLNQYSYIAPDEETLRRMEDYYYDNHSIREVAKEFNTTAMKLRVLRDKGFIHLERTPEQQKVFRKVKAKGRKHTEETKKKLSEIRKKWIAENPDKSPYLMSHKSRGETYPEKYFREWMEKESIPFQQEYRFKLYAFDFLVNERVDLEIDGDQHKNDKRIIKHDIKRDAKSQKAGFIVYRIMWSDYQKLSQEEKKNFLYDLKNFLMDNSNPIPEFVIKKHSRPQKNRKQNKVKKLKTLIKHKVDESLYQYDYRYLMAAEMFENGYTLSKISDVFDVKYNSVRRWIYKICDNEIVRKNLKQNKKKHGTNKRKIVSTQNKNYALELLKLGKTYCEVARHFKVSDNAIRKWIKSLGLNPSHYGRDGNKNKQRVCSSAV